jgi:hypothetical protein
MQGKIPVLDYFFSYTDECWHLIAAEIPNSNLRAVRMHLEAICTVYGQMLQFDAQRQDGSPVDWAKAHGRISTAARALIEAYPEQFIMVPVNRTTSGRQARLDEKAAKLKRQRLIEELKDLADVHDKRLADDQTKREKRGRRGDFSRDQILLRPMIYIWESLGLKVATSFGKTTRERGPLVRFLMNAANPVLKAGPPGLKVGRPLTPSAARAYLRKFQRSRGRVF